MPVSSLPEPRTGAAVAAVGSAPSRTLPLIDVALVPYLLGLAVAAVTPAAVSGSSAGRAFAALALGSLVALAFARDPFGARRSVRDGLGLLALVAGLYVVSRSWALSPGGSMTEGARMAAFVLVVWAGHVALQRPLSRVVLVGAVGAFGAWMAAPELWHAVRDGAPPTRVPGRLGYWNATAVVSLVLAPLAVLLAQSGRRWAPPVAGVLVAASAASAAATASRGALLATLVALVVFTTCSPRRVRGAWCSLAVALGLGAGVVGIGADAIPAWATLALVVAATTVLTWLGGHRGSVGGDAPRAPRRLLPAGVPTAALVGGAISAVAAALVIGVVIRSSGDGAVAKATSGNDVGRLATTDDSLRFGWWQDAWRLWQHGRVFGQGGDAFESDHVNSAANTVAHTHSLPLQLLVELGLVGLLVAVAGTALIARGGAAGRRSSERAFGAAVVALVLAQSVVDWTWSLPQVMLVLAAGLVLALPRPWTDRADGPGADSRPGAPAMLATLAVIGALVCLALVPFGASLLADQSARHIDHRSFAKASSEARQSMQLLPSFDTLQLEVIAEELDGRPNAAKRTLRDTEAIWSARPEGLLFAQERLGDDPEFGPRIAKRSAELAARQASQIPTP